MKTSDPKSPRSKAPRKNNVSPEMAEPHSSAAASPDASTPGRSDGEIARRAYHRWEQSGGSHGDDQRHWYEAEREMGSASPAERT